MHIKNEKQKQQLGHRARLRQKILYGSKKGLLDYEILELILCSAHIRSDVKPIAKRLLEHFGSFTKIFYASLDDLKQIKGIGESSIAAIFCIKEALERMLKDDLKNSVVINSWKKLINYLKISIGNYSIENFHIIYLNKKLYLIADDIQNVGTVDQTPIYIREIIKRALALGASSIIISHNHPTGDPTPSDADLNVTQQLNKACLSMNINLLDHVVVTPKGYYSFKSHGLL